MYLAPYDTKLGSVGGEVVFAQRFCPFEEKTTEM